MSEDTKPNTPVEESSSSSLATSNNTAATIRARLFPYYRVSSFILTHMLLLYLIIGRNGLLECSPQTISGPCYTNALLSLPC